MTGAKVGEAFVELHYKLDSLARDLKIARAAIKNQVDDIKKDADDKLGGMFGQVNAALEGFNSKLGVVGRLAVVAFAVEGAKAAGQFATAIAEAGTQVKLMQARLTSVLGQGGFDLAVESANKLGVSIDSAADAMAKLGTAGKDIGLTARQTQELTENFIMLGRVSGASAEDLANAMRQFGQALGSGVLRGDELNSVFEATPEVIRTIADALGITVGEIRGMAAEGRLTADVIASAMLGATDSIRERFAELPDTLEQSQARWANAFTQLMASLDNALHVSDFWKFITGGSAELMDRATVALGGGDVGTQERVMKARLEQLRGGDSGTFTNNEAANRAEIADLEQKLADLRPARIGNQAFPISVERAKTPAQQQAAADAAKEQAKIDDARLDELQRGLEEEQHATDQALAARKAAREKAAADAAAATKAAQSDAQQIIKQAMSAADTYAATVERLDGYLKKGQITQQTYNEAVAGAKQALDEANAAAARKEAADQEREANAARRAAKDRERADEKLRRDHEEQQAAVQKQMDQWKQQDPRGYFQATEDPELARIYDLQSGVEGAFQDMQDSALEFGRIGGQAVTQMADIASGAIADWVMGSKMDIEELAKALQKQVIMQFLQIAIKGAIGAGFGAAFGGGGGGTDTISTSYTGGKGYGGGYNGDYSNYARGGVFDHGSVVPLARGGIVNGGQLVPLSRGAALIGEAGPEGVLPLRRNSRGQLGVMNSGGAAAGGGGGGAQLVVNDMRGAGAQPIETRERRGPDGTRVIEATIRDTSRKQISRGDHDAAFGERYSMKPTPVK